MRRKVMVATAITMLVAASAAYAALNTYGANLAFSSKAGSAKGPSALGFTQTLTAANAVASHRAAPLIDIKTTMYGVVANSAAVPTCADATRMSTSKSDSFCPQKALVATGPVNALLGGTDLSKTGTVCNPFLHVWNAGKNKLLFFFTTDATHTCGSLHTGDTQAYPGTVSRSGKNLIIDRPLPSYVSTQVAHTTGLYGSLVHEVLTWKKLTGKVKGKTVGFLASVGCSAGKRPWTVAYTATDATNTKETKTVTGSSKC